MSSLRFKTQEQSVEVDGAERNYMARTLVNIGLGAARSRLVETGSTIKESIRRRCQGRAGKDPYGIKEFERFRTTVMASFGQGRIAVKGRELSLTNVTLNTAMDVGSDVVEFLGRLHHQCELHMYIKPRNTKELRKVIEQGVEFGLLRAKKDWNNVMSLAQEAEEPIVTSYSVAENFPNPDYWDQADSYDKADPERRWSVCLDELQNHEDLCYQPDQQRVRYSRDDQRPLNWFEVDRRIQDELRI